MTFDTNLTNFTTQWAYYGLQPYIAIFGDVFIGMLLLIIGAGVYIGTDKNSFVTSAYLFVASLVFAPVMGLVTGGNFIISTMMLLIVAMVFSAISYEALVERKR